MRVSCIIPTRNRKEMVLKAIASVTTQNGEKPELIVVDDGSSDSTAAAVEEIYPSARLVQTDGLGPGIARNKGVEAASGDFLMFLDSDDLWMPDHVRTLTAVLSKGFFVAYGVTRTVDEINGGEFLIPNEFEYCEGDCFSNLLKWCFLVPSAVAIKREAFEAVNGFGEEPYGEDWLFFIRLASLFPFGFAAGKPITMRLLHNGSLCCLSGNSKILQLIQNIISLLEGEARVGFKEIAHFMRLEQFVIHRGKGWKSIQEWYMAMQEEGII